MLYGDDVLVGPARDPARRRGARAAATSPPPSASIADAGRAGHSDFIAGGIGQGEATLWQASKVTRGEQPVPVGERWYHYGASDPAAVVRSAAACAYPSKACYALVDRGVLRQLQAAGKARGLRIVVARNTGGAAGSNAALAHPVRAYATKRAGSATRALLALLTSPALQAAIGRYPAPGTSAYHAAATPLVLLEQGIPDLKGRLTEGTPGGHGLAGVAAAAARGARGPPARRARHHARPTPTGRSPSRFASTPSRKLRGSLVLHSDPSSRPVGRGVHDRPRGLAEAAGRATAACAWAGASSMNACASQQASALNASSSASEESSAGRREPHAGAARLDHERLRARARTATRSSRASAPSAPATSSQPAAMRTS